MHPRAAALIDRLGLLPHPEGGYYREVFRSAAEVRAPDAGPARPAMTTIYFLLPAGRHSRWHRVRSDELWHFYEGGGVELFRATPDLARLERALLGPAGAPDGALPVQAVTGGWWQAARTRGDFSLAGCTVGPGFDFADLEFLGDDPARSAALARLAPDLAALA